MSIDHSILGVISLYPSTGYDIKTEFEHKGASLYWGISFGSIYPRLQKLEKKGFIQTIQIETEGRAKKLYELTGTGWLELERWLHQGTEYPTYKDELLLKVALWDGDKPEERAKLIQHLLIRKARSRELLNYYDEWSKNGTSSISEYGMFLIDYVSSRLTSELDWIDRTIKRLEQPPQPPIQDPKDLVLKRKLRKESALAQNKKN